MTWAELKKALEDQGVTDQHEIGYIDVDLLGTDAVYAVFDQHAATPVVYVVDFPPTCD